MLRQIFLCILMSMGQIVSVYFFTIHNVKKNFETVYLSYQRVNSHCMVLRNKISMLSNKNNDYRNIFHCEKIMLKNSSEKKLYIMRFFKGCNLALTSVSSACDVNKKSYFEIVVRGRFSDLLILLKSLGAESSLMYLHNIRIQRISADALLLFYINAVIL